MSTTTVSAVVLTQGDRPEAIARALRSIRQAGSRSDVGVQIVVVWNGVPVDPSVDSDVSVELPDNVGIPEGRNRGLAQAGGELVLFLDDDAVLTSTVDLADLVRMFDDDRRLAVVAMRIRDEFGQTAQRHVPRLGGRSAARSGEVALFLGGASMHRRSVFEAAGGYAGPFFYAMEESDLALRLVDRGATIWYRADLMVEHPLSLPSRHRGSLQRTARNRVWSAHRNLPLPLAIVYVSNWCVLTIARNVTSLSAVRAVMRGFTDGARRPLGPRRPIGWRTVWRLIRLGRPPVL